MIELTHGIGLTPGANQVVTSEEISNAVGTVAPDYGVSRATLFGSYARGDQAPDSDVDLVVELSRPLGFKRAELGERLSEAIGVPVDLVFGAKQLYEPVRSAFEQEGRVVYEG